jgi:hypothetical protein
VKKKDPSSRHKRILFGIHLITTKRNCMENARMFFEIGFLERKIGIEKKLIITDFGEYAYTLPKKPKS